MANAAGPGHGMRFRGRAARRLRPALVACAGARAATIDDVAWIAGCWAIEDAEPGSGEQWTAAAGGTMLGTNRAVRDGQMAAHEFLLIRETEDESLVYLAAPEGRTATAFTLISVGPTLVAFENALNEFPERIIYRLEGENRLVARIEGTVDGELTAVDFPMQRIACPGG
jgi:hypothetical protein